MQKKIAIYLSHENEIDLSALIPHSHMLQKNIYLPVVNHNTIEFYLMDADTYFVQNKFGIFEPRVANNHPISAETLDLIFMPVVAFDSQNNRIGRGAGYYDRALQFIQSKHTSHPKLIGVAYHFQKVDVIAADKWDVKMDCVIDPS